ncbi:hypothetical protein NPIL_11201 [Nephila pilipes]|uniref:Uncharacterized protein n=1 Tax=Nephila pilipes TaxID=299642 RepID=A0A8X6UPL9_NEPPI|nr:hypothetical protein NPIL_11201 [Nephila pilipes]
MITQVKNQDAWGTPPPPAALSPISGAASNTRCEKPIPQEQKSEKVEQKTLLVVFSSPGNTGSRDTGGTRSSFSITLSWQLQNGQTWSSSSRGSAVFCFISDSEWFSDISERSVHSNSSGVRPRLLAVHLPPHGPQSPDSIPVAEATARIHLWPIAPEAHLQVKR